MIVDDRHGDPVVGHTFGEGEREHEEPDQQGARFSPGRERAPPLDLEGGLRRFGGLAARVVRRDGRVVVVVFREEPGRGDDDRRDQHERRRHEVHGHGYPAGDHRRADQCTGDGPQAEAGVETGHDGSTQLLLDVSPVHVDRHVPRPAASPKRNRPTTTGATPIWYPNATVSNATPSRTAVTVTVRRDPKRAITGPDNGRARSEPTATASRTRPSADGSRWSRSRT